MISTRRHLQYATGFLELGMSREAGRELRAIRRADRETPKALVARIDLHTMLKQWPSMLALSRKLTRSQPGEEKGWISWAYALRELNRVAEAKQVLLRALQLHGKTCDVLHYNLACYDCLLGNFPAANGHLAFALRKDREWKQVALSDPDLKPLWPEIDRMTG